MRSTSSSFPISSYSFELVEMDASDDPKLGYKVKTTQGYQIISPEMAFTIFLQKLINIYQKYTGKNAEVVKFRLIDIVLTEEQKEAIIDIGNQLKKDISFLKY